MANRYFVGDSIDFKGVFKSAGVEQTPASVLVTIKNTSGGIIVEDVAGTVTGNEVSYTDTDVAEGQYTLYFTATFSGPPVQERTGTIKYRVVAKDGKQS